MTQPERLRVEWRYEPNTPQCFNCVAYRRARMAHDDRGVIIAQRAICGKGRFEIHPTGCCSKWSSRTGERLAP